jgi:ankyrin repeat protein
MINWTMLDADPRIRTKQGHETALIFACQNGHFGIAELLVKTDPELLRIATVAGTLPLHVAAQAGNVEMVQYLLDNGAEIDAKKSDGANGRVFNFLIYVGA